MIPASFSSASWDLVFKCQPKDINLMDVMWTLYLWHIIYHNEIEKYSDKHI